MTDKQIMHFGTKRQRAALASRRRRKRNIDAYTDKYGYVHPIRGTKGYKKKLAFGDTPARRNRSRNRRRRKNSALVLSLGAAPGLAGNPRRNRRKKVARARNRRRRASYNPRRRRTYNRRRHYTRNPRRSHNRRRHYRRNRVVYVHLPKRRRNRRHYRRMSNRRHHYRRNRRNPQVLGYSLTSKNALKLIGGGILGVVAVQFIPSILPASLTSIGGGSPYVQVLITGVTAVAAGWLIGKMDADLGGGATFGGLMVAASQLINALVPGLSIGGVPIGVSGLGDLMPGQFAVPQNPLRLPAAPPQPSGSGGHAAGGGGARVSMSGLARAYGSAF